MQILIVVPPYRLSLTNFPLGLGYIAAVLQKAGHQVQVLDMDAYNYTTEIYVQKLHDLHYDVLCTGGMITAWNFLKFTADYVKEIKPWVKIVVGGGVISSTPESFIGHTQADVGVVGEGEETVVELLEAFESNRSIGNIQSIVYRDEEGKVIQTLERPPIQDPDKIPFPAWDLFDTERLYATYPSHNSLFKARRQLTVYTSRGCPFQCTLCYTEKMVRQRSIDNVLAEFEELRNRYKVKFILIADDLFVVRRERTIKFCEEMIRRKMDIKWSATGRCNLVDREFLKLMKAAGCEFMGLGIESGSNTVLKAIKKSQTDQQIINAVKAVRDAGIVPGGTFILGLPPETPQTVRETVEVYKTINSYRTHCNRFFFATPYPGTPLYDEMVTKGRIKDEVAYFEGLSKRGDAVDFVMNCTEAFEDEELVKTKAEIEKEVFSDFIKKHPLYAVWQFLTEKTPWKKINVVLLLLKMKGLVATYDFVITKIKVKLGLKEDPYSRRNWVVASRPNYSTAQALFEGWHMPTVG